MKYSEISEAPVGDLQVHHMDEPGTFPDRDRRLLSNPAHVDKIRKRFDTVSFDFDLYFVNQPSVHYARDLSPEEMDYETGIARNPAHTSKFTQQWFDDNKVGGEHTTEFIKQRFGISITPNPNNITVVYVSNANEENNVSMTPWIVAHRFGHALTDNKLELRPALRRLLYELPDMYSSIIQGEALKITDVMTNRSARLGTLNPGEAIEELIAQYIIHGQIKLALRPGTKVKSNPHDINDRLIHLGRKITVLIDKIMDECVGHIFVSL